MQAGMSSIFLPSYSEAHPKKMQNLNVVVLTKNSVGLFVIILRCAVLCAGSVRWTFLAVNFWLMTFPIVYVAADSTLLSLQLLIELKRNHSELPLSVGDLIGKISASWGKPQALQFLGVFCGFVFDKINDAHPHPQTPLPASTANSVSVYQPIICCWICLKNKERNFQRNLEIFSGNGHCLF